VNKTWKVLRYELISTLSRRSFLVVAFILPLASSLLFVGVAALNRSSPETLTSVIGTLPQQGGVSQEAEGYVDLSGLVQTIPETVPPGSLVAFADEAAARQALAQEQISAFYIIPADYLQRGELIYIRPDFNPLSAFDQAGLMRWVLRVNLLGGDWQLANQATNPLQLEVTLLDAGASDRDQNNPLTFFLPYAVTLLYYVLILMSSSLLLNSVTKEKENRVLEILMSSASPRQLLTGKITGLGIASLIQAVIWVGTSFVILRLAGRSFDIPQAFQLPLSFLVWGVIFFVLGYAVYASLMASVGALAPNLREASQATFIVIIPMVIPLMMISIIINDPNGTLATILSLFPLTAPVTMMTRLAAINVPLWQTALSAILLGVTAVWIVRTVANMFRAQTLLSGLPFSPKRLFQALSGKL
jgi:ABC-2 type transport system permease protein